MAMFVQRLALLAALFVAASCAQQSSEPSNVSLATESTSQPARIDSKRTLTLAWNRETYQVPEPVVMTPEMERSVAYREWWKRGDVRTLEFTDSDGRRITAEMMGRAKDQSGRLSAVTGYVCRYRTDGTLETKTFTMPDGPCEWTVYAADGKTPTIRVTNRLNGIEGTPYIENVYFIGADGKRERGYQANRYGVAYIEWFYNHDGSPSHWNGSSKLDGPLAVAAPEAFMPRPDR